MVADDKDFEFDRQRAEVFDALGHPTRIAILKALSEGSMGFAELKKKTGIQSSGHLQHHINKLSGLVKTDEYGKYCLSDQGKDALLTVDTVEDAACPAKKPRSRMSAKKLAAVLLVAVIVTASVTAWTFDRIDTHERWATLLRQAQDYRSHMDEVYTLLAYYADPQAPQSRALHNEIDSAFVTLHEIQRTDPDNDVTLSIIDSFMISLRDPDLNLTKLSPEEKTDLAIAVREVGSKLLNAYGAILNYTSMNYISGPPFWYFGPSSPNQETLQEAAAIAVNAQQLIS